MGKKDQPIERLVPDPDDVFRPDPSPARLWIVLRGPRQRRSNPISAWQTREEATQAAGSEDTVVEYHLCQSYRLVLTPQ